MKRDNMKAIMDIRLFYHRKNMKLVSDGPQVTKSKASSALNNNAQLLVYQWRKSLYFPDGYV